MAGASRSIVIDAPPDRVFEVIIDYDRYAEFLREVEGGEDRQPPGQQRSTCTTASTW
jgi:uncharacterized protein YndB with AHSA1/START domain